MACALGFAARAVAAAEVQNVTDGSALGYQASVIRSADDAARIVVFERLDPVSVSGDLWLTRSIDDGAHWSAPAAVIASGANERHPALLQLGPARYALFYLKGSGSNAGYRIWRATSSDGLAFVEQGAIDLGWPDGAEVNPHVIRRADGTLTLSYQRLGSGSYIAESSDGGVSWDTLRTAIAAGSQLPRIAYRESDGVYLASYQVSSSALALYVKTTTDVHDWSAPARDFAITGNHHDSLPVVMPDGAFAVFWIRASGSQFDIAVRRSIDGSAWSPALAVTDSPQRDDVEPHPLVGAASDRVELYWGRGAAGGGLDYDIVRQRDVPISDAVFADGFDGAAR